MPSTLVLINSGAGTVRKEGAHAFAQQIRKGMEARGLSAEVAVVKGEDLGGKAEAFVKSAAGFPEARQKTLIVGGGDGTINTAASLASLSNAVLGILPLGTLNHFAKDLGIPATLDGALDVIAAGNVRTVDVGEVNGRIFVNNSSIGIYPFLVEQRTAEQRRWKVGKVAAIGPALVRTLRHASWHRLTVVTQGGQQGDSKRELRTPCLFVGNNNYDLSALGRRSDLSAGRLCVYIVRRDSWWGLISLPFKVALRGALHRLDPEHDVELLNVSELAIHSYRPRLRIAIDGETLHEATPLIYRSRPRALQVLAPPRKQHEPAHERASEHTFA